MSRRGSDFAMARLSSWRFAGRMSRMAKYFTRELLQQFQSDRDDVADKADADWERAVARYRERLGRIKRRFPKRLRQFQQDGICLHDARVLMMRQVGLILDLV